MKSTEIPHLHGKKAVDKIREIANNQVAFLCTHTESFTINARPMTTIDITDDGRLRFFVGEDQDAVDQIKARNQVDLLYQNSSSYLSIRGHARIYRDQETINELYNPIINAWFDGKEDPGLHILEVSVDDAHYWSNKNGKITTLYKLAQAALTGDDVDMGVSGDLHV